MRVAIMQPTFFPWLGYFKMIQESDKFVFLDNVAISFQSWQTRNYFNISGEKKWISVPLAKNFSSQNHINEIQIKDYDFFIKKFEKTIQQEYAGRNFYSDINELIYYLRSHEFKFLVDFNIFVITWFCKRFNINSNIYRATEFNLPNDRIGRLVEISKILKCNEYLSPLGSKDYLTPFLDHFDNANIKVIFMSDIEFNYTEEDSFVNTSCLDWVARFGFEGCLSKMGEVVV